MKRTRNLLIVVGALLVVIVLAVLASHRGGSNATPVKVQKLALAPFTIKLPENGTVQHPGTITIPTLVGGNIAHIYVKAGDHVSAGELLATIDNPSVQFSAAGSSADYRSSVADVYTARVNEQNSKVQYQGTVDTQQSAYEEAKRVYDADVALYAQRAIPRSQVDADKAKLDQAKVAYDQAIEQLKLGAVSGYGQNSVQAAQAAAEKARIVDRQNEQQVAFLRIVAPMSGIVQTIANNPNDALRSVQQGDPVTAGQALFTMAQSSGYIVKAQVDEQDIINVHLGMPVNVTGQDFPGKTLRGHVSAIAPVAQKSTDASSTSMQVLTTIALDDSPEFLKDGMSADVDILTTDIPQALSVPNGAIQKDKGKPYVFMVENGVAKKRTIVLGKAGDSTTLVASGLAPGDSIVATNTPGLLDGAKVTPLPSSSPSVLGSPSSSP
jgi:HlyD family secretion protein